MLDILSKDLNSPVHERYNFKPLRGSSHWWALNHLKGQVTGKRILDVGAGGGGIGRAIKAEAPKELVAIEIDLRAHEILAEHYDRVLTDITPVKNEQFDWIIILDVLEHLAKPAVFLANLRDLLAPGGSILISVPNVAHWSVRIPLFFWGSFEYRSVGIMDGTHLQFFSRRSLIKLCSSLEKIHIKEISASIEPFELALPRWATNNRLYSGLIPCRHWAARALPGLMAYQHLVLLRGG
jgi:2-polyprenyl-3-methyl-5-hydroxy-6-metoxy-1,4-benzoquinol methylase